MTESSGRGFDGLSDFKTDVDGAIAKADKIAAGPRPAPPPRSAPRSTPVHRDTGAFVGGLKKLGGWILGIGLIVAVKACILGGVRAVSDSASSSSSYSTSSSSDQSAGYVTNVDEATVPHMPATSEGDETATIGEAVAASDADSATTRQEHLADDGALVKPLPGYARLSISELRYCLAEDMRITAQKTELESLQHNDADRFNRNVDTFNDAVNDYNSRCANRSIAASDRPLATAQIERQRLRLQAEGSDRVQ